jgi:hypothetical protein
LAPYGILVKVLPPWLRGLRWVAKALFVLLLVVVPVPVAVFFTRRKDDRKRAVAEQIVRREER